MGPGRVPTAEDAQSRSPGAAARGLHNTPLPGADPRAVQRSGTAPPFGREARARGLSCPAQNVSAKPAICIQFQCLDLMSNFLCFLYHSNFFCNE